jgi:plastocyanin
MAGAFLRAIVAAFALGATAVPTCAATIRIASQSLVFKPAEVSAKVGDTVEWTNDDFVAHTATARNGDFDVMIPPKKTASFVLKKAGTVDYYCRLHPNMKATLKIEP